MKKKKKKDNSMTIRFLVLGVFSVVLISLFFTSISEVWLNIFEKYNEKEKLSNELVALKESNESMEIDVEKLKDPEYISRYLKEKYFYSSDDEYIIRIQHEDEEEDE